MLLAQLLVSIEAQLAERTFSSHDPSQQTSIRKSVSLLMPGVINQAMNGLDTTAFVLNGIGLPYEENPARR